MRIIIRDYKIFNIKVNDETIDLDTIDFAIFNTDTNKIVIYYADSCVLYITNKNWNLYKKEERTYKNILFMGPVDTIRNNWIYFEEDEIPDNYIENEMESISFMCSNLESW